jgi:hypothetical protein
MYFRFCFIKYEIQDTCKIFIILLNDNIIKYFNKINYNFIYINNLIISTY